MAWLVAYSRPYAHSRSNVWMKRSAIYVASNADAALDELDATGGFLQVDSPVILDRAVPRSAHAEGADGDAADRSNDQPPCAGP